MARQADIRNVPGFANWFYLMESLSKTKYSTIMRTALYQIFNIEA